MIDNTRGLRGKRSTLYYKAELPSDHSVGDLDRRQIHDPPKHSGSFNSTSNRHFTDLAIKAAKKEADKLG